MENAILLVSWYTETINNLDIPKVSHVLNNMLLFFSKYGAMPTFQYQRVFTRVILILGVLTVVYFGTKDGREFALAKQKEIVHDRAQDIMCSSDYKAELESFSGSLI